MIINPIKLKVFSGRANIPLAEKIARHLGDTLGKITLSNFPDGEISVRIEEDVRGRDIYLVQPTCPPVNDNLMELLIMLDCFKRASALAWSSAFDTCAAGERTIFTATNRPSSSVPSQTSPKPPAPSLPENVIFTSEILRHEQHIGLLTG